MKNQLADDLERADNARLAEILDDLEQQTYRASLTGLMPTSFAELFVKAGNVMGEAAQRLRAMPTIAGDALREIAVAKSADYLADSDRCQLAPLAGDGDYCRFNDACVAVQLAYVAAYCEALTATPRPASPR